ncbi:MAG: transposase, partial [Chloroflexota bacterium]|nr:transposase [Chloroflexota bacterium]
ATVWFLERAKKLSGGNHTMAKNRMALLELLRKSGADGDIDFLREGVKVLVEAIMELEVTRDIGAGLHERNPYRSAYRNGYRERVWDTRVSSVSPESQPNVKHAISKAMNNPVTRYLFIITLFN